MSNSRYRWGEFNGSADDTYEPVYQLIDTHNDRTIALITPNEGEFEVLFLVYRVDGRAGLASRDDMTDLKFDTLEEAQAVSLAFVTLT